MQITATNTITRKTGPIYVTKVVTGETDGLLPGTDVRHHAGVLGPGGPLGDRCSTDWPTSSVASR